MSFITLHHSIVTMFVLFDMLLNHSGVYFVWGVCLWAEVQIGLGFTLLTSSRTNQDALSMLLSYCSTVWQYVEREDISIMTWALTSKEWNLIGPQEQQYCHVSTNGRSILLYSARLSTSTARQGNNTRTVVLICADSCACAIGTWNPHTSSSTRATRASSEVPSSRTSGRSGPARSSRYDWDRWVVRASRAPIGLMRDI